MGRNDAKHPPNKSAGMLITTVEKFPTGTLIKYKEILEKTRHCYLIYENFPLGTLIPGGTLIWYVRVMHLVGYKNLSEINEHTNFSSIYEFC